MIVLLGGTADARQAARVLLQDGYEVLLCVVTEHAARIAWESLKDTAANTPVKTEGEAGLADRVGPLGPGLLHVRVGALDRPSLQLLLESAEALVDATHPFATRISPLAETLCAERAVPYVRIDRERQPELYTGVTLAADAETAARLCVAEGGRGTIFVTVGTRTLEVYVEAARKAGRRLVARVLPTTESLARCLELGLRPQDIVALQGPPRARLDEALLRHFEATVMVMKESGEAGGLQAKLAACRRTGTKAIVVSRPAASIHEGTTVTRITDLSSVLTRFGVSRTRPTAELPPPARPTRDAVAPRSKTPVTPARPGRTSPSQVLMVAGTGSHVGKTVLVAALCRLYARRGMRVAPFKAQNMALNSFVTPEGGEIGRAQAYQAAAAGLEPNVDMNPVLLKPSSPTGCQVVVLGRPVGHMSVHDYHAYQKEVWPTVASALDRLRDSHDLVIIEGAGGVAEVNLRAQDIVNMRVARYCQAPTLIVGDIDRGGVFASLFGSFELLDPGEQDLVKGFVINKFRGDHSLLAPGISFLEGRTGVPVLGVLPYLTDWCGDEEDSLGLPSYGEGLEWPPDDSLRVAIVRLPYISNYTDFATLEQEVGVCLRYVSSPERLQKAHLIVIPGTKSTVNDLRWLHERGLAETIRNMAEEGRPLIGICGGYQMLGRVIRDPLGVESESAETPGLGLLEVETVFATEKRTVRVSGELTGAALGPAGTPLHGYEIHMGRTDRIPGTKALLRLRGEDGTYHLDGAVSARGNVVGAYVHGLFDHPAMRACVLSWARATAGLTVKPVTESASESREWAATREQAIERLCRHVETHLDLGLLNSIIGFNEQTTGVRS